MENDHLKILPKLENARLKNGNNNKPVSQEALRANSKLKSKPWENLVREFSMGALIDPLKYNERFIPIGLFNFWMQSLMLCCLGH